MYAHAYIIVEPVFDLQLYTGPLIRWFHVGESCLSQGAAPGMWLAQYPILPMLRGLSFNMKSPSVFSVVSTLLSPSGFY